ncbi:hypothetical protein [Streptomyces sp. NPDC088246]|uniref:hypothetical protein n=1 Tax=Streptomyces sp. NPDC088246 TaxID=3365842 RepID=UPI00381F0A2B
MADKHAETWDFWLNRLSPAFIEIVLSEPLQSPEGLCDFLGEPDEENLALLEEHCTQLAFPEYPVSQEPPGIRWFAGPDALLRDDGRMVLSVRARTEQALDRVGPARNAPSPGKPRP